MPKQFDLVIKNGVVVTSGDVGPLDIAIKDGKIAHLAASIPEDAAERVIDAEWVRCRQSKGRGGCNSFRC